MSDLNCFLNEYQRDSELLSDFRREGLHPDKVIFPFYDLDLSREFGALVFDAKLEHRKKKERRSSTRYLLAFQDCLLVCEVLRVDSSAGEETYRVLQWFSTHRVKRVTADMDALTLTLLVVQENMAQLDECILKLKNKEVSKTTAFMLRFHIFTSFPGSGGTARLLPEVDPREALSAALLLRCGRLGSQQEGGGRC